LSKHVLPLVKFFTQMLVYVLASKLSDNVQVKEFPAKAQRRKGVEQLAILRAFFAPPAPVRETSFSFSFSLNRD